MPSPHQPEADSPELDAFLRGAVLRRLQGSERRAALHAAWTDGAQSARGRADSFDLETKPLRIMVMWRLTRTTAIVKGLCAEDETLDSATELEPSPWTHPWKPLAAGMAGGGSALRRARASQLLKLHASADGLPLLPPRSGDLRRWCDAAALVAADLGIERSSEGLLGLQGLLDPTQCARCDVSVAEVLAFEELLLQGSLDMLLDKGERAALKHFKEHYGFTHKEANGLLRVVKTQALERSAASIEEKRALQEMRLEDYIGRTKESMDMDGEMKGIKELAKIQGLTRTEPEDQAAEFFNVVKRVSLRQDKGLPDPATTRILDVQRAEAVEAKVIETREIPPTTDPDDAEALAEFDNENQHK